jgi:hypothetical protein
MGLFSRKSEPQAPAAPVDRRKVLRLTAAIMQERDAQESPAWDAALARMNNAYRGTTQAERRAAIDAARRHGY